MRPVYFPNLNGLRFVAALLVFYHHVEQVRFIGKLTNRWDSYFTGLCGSLGVNIFFVLSGFLITYLLLKEKSETGVVDLKAYYKRRFLRIIPLYVFGLVVGILLNVITISRHTNYFHTSVSELILPLSFYCLLIPNFVWIYSSPLQFISQFWSLGAESQFYLFFPWLIRNKTILYSACIGIILLFESIRIFHSLNYFQSPAFTLLATQLSYCKFDLLIVGALGAIIYRAKRSIPIIMLLSCFVTLILPTLEDFFWGITIVTALVYFAGKPYWVLENKLMNYLGKISYGIYVYHLICITLVQHLFKSLHFNSHLSYLAAALVLTIALSATSYQLFEKKFLKLK